MYIRYFFKYLAHPWLGVPICGSIFENTVELLSPLPVAFEHWWASAHRHAVCGACGEVLRIKHRYIYNTVFIFYMYIGNMGKTSACQGGALRRGSCGNNLFGKFRRRRGTRAHADSRHPRRPRPPLTRPHVTPQHPIITKFVSHMRLVTARDSCINDVHTVRTAFNVHARYVTTASTRIRTRAGFDVHADSGPQVMILPPPTDWAFHPGVCCGDNSDLTVFVLAAHRQQAELANSVPRRRALGAARPKHRFADEGRSSPGRRADVGPGTTRASRPRARVLDASVVD